MWYRFNDCVHADRKREAQSNVGIVTGPTQRTLLWWWCTSGGHDCTKDNVEGVRMLECKTNTSKNTNLTEQQED